MQCIVIAPFCIFVCVCLFICLWVHLTTASAQCLHRLWAFFMRPSSLGGGRILRCTLPVCLSVRLSVRPVIERHVAPPSELQWHTCTFRHALRAAYCTAISAAQILVFILVKLSLLAKWLARKTPLKKPNCGKGIISIKPRLKRAYGCVGLLYSVIV